MGGGTAWQAGRRDTCNEMSVCPCNLGREGRQVWASSSPGAHCCLLRASGMPCMLKVRFRFVLRDAIYNLFSSNRNIL